MENDNNEMVEIPEIPQAEEGQEDTIDWRAEALKYQGIAKRYDTKLKKLSEQKPEAKPEVKQEAKPQDKTEFDLAEETYLLQKGVRENQFGMVLDELKSSKLPLKELMNSPYFKEKLEMATTKDALPTDSKRGVGAARNEVDYWLSKGELPPKTPENTELRRKVVAALVKKAESGSKFSSNPIV